METTPCTKIQRRQLFKRIARAFNVDFHALKARVQNEWPENLLSDNILVSGFVTLSHFWRANCLVRSSFISNGVAWLRWRFCTMYIGSGIHSL